MKTVTKTDFKKSLKPLYAPSSKGFSVVEVPKMNFLMIDGQGNPNNSPLYRDALQALYPLAYKLKFMSKLDLGRDYVVPPLEGLWWADDMDDFVTRKKDNWKWRMMIMQPDWITPPLVEEARLAVTKKASSSLPHVQFDQFEEGKSVQILHVGSYDDEGPVLNDLHNRWLAENNYSENGLHHEIYLSDPRKSNPEKLKTILRQPIK